MRILLAAAAVVASLAGLSAQRASLVLLVNVAEYFGNTYVDERAEGLHYIFFVGEPIRLDIQVLNADEQEHTVVSTSSTARGAFSVTAVRDEQPTTVGLAVNPNVQRHEDEFRIPIEWGTTRLNPRAAVHWQAELASTLPPGSYTVDLATDALDEKARPVAPHASRVRFEVREGSPDAMPEIIRRQAVRAYVAGMFDVAEREATALLRLHPNSLEAYIVLGRVAEAQGRAPAARAALQRALELTTSGDDTLHRNMSLSRIGDLREHLQSELARLSAR
jgi:hypothetical protein